MSASRPVLDIGDFLAESCDRSKVAVVPVNAVVHAYRAWAGFCARTEYVVAALGNEGLRVHKGLVYGLALHDEVLAICV